MTCGRSLGDASVITLRSRIDIKVTRMNIRGATMGSIGGYVFTTYIKDKSILAFKTLFRERMRLLSQTDGKLQLYGKLKREYKYEKFLDVGYMRAKSLLKLRMSLHNFPIERGRYANPAVLRHDRICQFCRSDSVGDKFHLNTRQPYEQIHRILNNYMMPLYLYNQ